MGSPKTAELLVQNQLEKQKLWKLEIIHGYSELAVEYFNASEFITKVANYDHDKLELNFYQVLVIFLVGSPVSHNVTKKVYWSMYNVTE